MNIWSKINEENTCQTYLIRELVKKKKIVSNFERIFDENLS